MKKFTKILSSIAFVFVLMLTSTLFVACGSKDETTPVNLSVKNTLFKATNDAYCVWPENYTLEDKMTFLESYGSTGSHGYTGEVGNVEQEKQYIAEREEEFKSAYADMNFAIYFQDNGIARMSYGGNNKYSVYSSRYEQSADLKTISISSINEDSTDIKQAASYTNNELYISASYGEDGNDILTVLTRLERAGNNPYVTLPTTAFSVVDTYVSFVSTKSLKLIWDENVTETEMNEVLQSYEVTNRTELANKVKESLGVFDFSNFSAEGSVSVDTSANKSQLKEVKGFKQSQDLKTITLYQDVECLQEIETCSIKFEDEKYWLCVKVKESKFTLQIALEIDYCYVAK